MFYGTGLPFSEATGLGYFSESELKIQGVERGKTPKMKARICI